MKTYKGMLNEVAPLAISPLTAVLGVGAVAGVFLAVKELVSDTIKAGVRFVVRNPVPVAVASIAFDQYFNQGKGTRLIFRYFQRSFPGQARAFYEGLTDIVVTKQITPDKVADMVTKIMSEFDKMKD